MSPQMLMLTSLLLVVLLIESGGNRNLYCSRKAGYIDTKSINDVFSIENKASKVTSHMSCEYSTLFDSSVHNTLFYMKILSADVVPDHSLLEIRDGQEDAVPLLRESFPDRRHMMFVTRTDMVHIKFTTLFYPQKSNSTGYHIRLTPFTTKVCPPNWTQLGAFCFSNSSAIFMPDMVANGKVDFNTAQYVCNRMRANLLVASPTVLKGSEVKDVGELMLKLKFMDPVWVGLVDNSDAGEGKLYWLDNSSDEASELQKEWLSCHLDGLKIPGGCESTERFAYLRPTTSGFLVFDRPESLHQFACYAPVGMTDEFFPTRPSPTTTAFIVSVGTSSSTASVPSPAPQTMSFLDFVLIGALALVACILFIVCLLRWRIDDEYRPTPDVAGPGPHGPGPDGQNILGNGGFNEVNPHDYVRNDGNREISIDSAPSSQTNSNNNQITAADQPPLVNAST